MHSIDHQNKLESIMDAKHLIAEGIIILEKLFYTEKEELKTLKSRSQNECNRDARTCCHLDLLFVYLSDSFCSCLTSKLFLTRLLLFSPVLSLYTCCLLPVAINLAVSAVPGPLIPSALTHLQSSFMFPRPLMFLIKFSFSQSFFLHFIMKFLALVNVCISGSF